MFNALPCKACILFHDSRQTRSKADMQYFSQQNDPMNPTLYQHHYTDIYQHKQDLLQTRHSVLHSACNAQGWTVNYMSDPNHLQHIKKKININLRKRKSIEETHQYEFMKRHGIKKVRNE